MNGSPPPRRIPQADRRGVAPSRRIPRGGEGLPAASGLPSGWSRWTPNESHHQLLIRLHAANHDRSSALRAYHQCMRVLRREMGVEPGPATQELFNRILKAEPRRLRRAETRLPAQKHRALVGRTMEWHR